MTDDRPLADARPTQARVAALFGARMAASHGLNIYLVWLAFTQQSHAAGAWVLVVRAISSMTVPMIVGRSHDRGSIAPWLRVAALVEAGAAASVAWLGWSGASSTAMVLLSLLLGATSGLFDTLVHPMVLGARPSRLRPHVLVGLSFDVAKVIGSSIVLLLLVAWDSPWPVMSVSLLSLVGWRLRPVDPPAAVTSSTVADVSVDVSADGTGSTRSMWRDMPRAPVVALMVVALLPGQLNVLNVLAADGSFRMYAVVATSFAIGAVVSNLSLQRIRVSTDAIALEYVLLAVAMLLTLVSPVLAFFAYGASMAGYFQMTRVVVVESGPAGNQGRAAATLVAASRTVGVLGSVLATSLLGSPAILAVGAAVLAVVAAGVVRTSKRSAAALAAA